MGIKCVLDPGISYASLEIQQWEVYDTLQGHIVEPATALSALADWMIRHKLERLIIKTQILIAPGYKIRMVKGLVTNFHQPESTLLLLVAALTGENWKKIYDYALTKDFRFLSYGDGCLLFAE
jgi:S-adenosylmethionine:tRNA ribosyltransferase-isomerase